MHLRVYLKKIFYYNSWGTKGDTSMKHDLGIVTTTEKGEVEIEQIDVSATYEEATNKLMRHVEKVNDRSKVEKQEGYYKTFRTRVVLFWLISNAILVIGIINAGEVLNSIPVSPQ